MTTVTVHARLTADELAAAIEQLDPAEADKMAQRLLRLQARRRTPQLDRREAELLQTIYVQKRSGFRARFDGLQEKRRSSSLTEREQRELRVLADEAEAFDARRLAALAELARLRAVGILELTEQLGIKAPPIV